MTPQWVRRWRCRRCGTELDSPADARPWAEPGQDRAYSMDWTSSSMSQGKVLADCDAEKIRLVMAS